MERPLPPGHEKCSQKRYSLLSGKQLLCVPHRPTATSPRETSGFGEEVGSQVAAILERRDTISMNPSHEQTEEATALWKLIQAELRQKVNAYGYDSFLSQLRLIEDTGSHLVIGYPADLCIEWVEVNYADQIGESALNVLQGARQLSFIADGAAAAHPCPAPAAAAEIRKPESAKRKSSKPKRTSNSFINSRLNENYRFDNFVVGGNNEFACAAAQAVARSSECLYSPLMIHGASGMGKTHLLHAIGNAIKAQDDSCQVLYITSEAFTNEYIEAISRSKRGDSLASFRKKYRKVDVLLIDDVQFLAGKNKTQEEFFHTFNTLFESGKRIVLSSDSPACEITGVEPRLASRFEAGLTVSVQPPCLETRMAILRRKRAEWKCNISDEIVSWLAEHIAKNVRRLEGALMRVAMMASFSQSSPSLESVRMILKDELREEVAHQVTIDDIQQRVADEFDIRVADMTGRRRTAHVARSRQIAMYLSRKLTGRSLQDIGAAFGGRDHGTVIHAARTIERKMEADVAMRERVARVESMLS